MLELVKDAEAFAAEIGTELTTLWDEFKAFVRNKPVEQPPCDNAHVADGCGKFAEPVVEAAPVVEPVAAPAIDVVS